MIDPEPGDLVVDQDKPHEDRGTAVVVRVLDEAAEDHYVDSLDATVATLNEDHPAQDRVVEVVFAGHLNGNVPGWRAMLRDARQTDTVSFWDLLAEYREDWGVPLRKYAYPVSRLGTRRYCPDHALRAEYVEPFPEAGESAGYVCPDLDCGYGTLPPNDDLLNADDERPRPEDNWTLPDGGTDDPRTNGERGA